MKPNETRSFKEGMQAATILIDQLPIWRFKDQAQITHVAHLEAKHSTGWQTTLIVQSHRTQFEALKLKDTT